MNTALRSNPNALRSVEMTPTTNRGGANRMQAMVYAEPGQIRLWDCPKPVLKEPGDAIVRVTRTTICGTDLHILKGDVPTAKPGRILGHEGVGVTCAFCRKQMYSHCTTGGWILGNAIDGTQAEYVRTPHADMSLYHIPEGANEEALVMLSDILPTGFECGVLNGKVQPGSSVAIVGAGPIGLAALLTAQFYSPAAIIMIDLDDNRLEIARRFGATDTVNSTDGKALEAVMKLTADAGVDTAIEAVGIPATFELCEKLVAAGGTIANIGVHGKPASLHLETLWDRNIAITTRLVDTATIPMLFKTVAANKINPTLLIAHHFTLAEGEKAYETFANAGETKALKVIITTA